MFSSSGCAFLALLLVSLAGDASAESPVATYKEPSNWCVEVSPVTGTGVEAEVLLQMRGALVSAGYQAYDAPPVISQAILPEQRVPPACEPNMWITVNAFTPIHAPNRVFGAIALVTSDRQLTGSITVEGWGMPAYLSAINISTAEIDIIGNDLLTNMNLALSMAAMRAVKTRP